jgi:hypothetical protein
VSALRTLVESRNREGFRPPCGLADRFTTERAWRLVYRLGLSPRGRLAESLAVDERWLRDLADELGVVSNRLKEWVKNSDVLVRRVGSRGHLAIRADAEEPARLGRLRDVFGPGRTGRYPVERTRPEPRSEEDGVDE